jgi:AraC-like DNA-binding protein
MRIDRNYEKIVASSRWLEPGLTPARPLTLSINHHPPRQPAYYDIHPGLELTIAVSGLVKRWVGPHSRVLRPGDVWLSNAFEPHGFQVLKGPADHFCIIFLPYLLAVPAAGVGIDFLAPFCAPPPSRPQPQTALIRKKFIAAAREMVRLDAHDPYAREEIMAYVRIVLAELLRGWQRPARAKQSAVPVAITEIVPSLNLVRTAAARVTLEQAARACLVGKTQFMKKFKALMGVNFHEYEQKYRLALVARDLLAGTEKLEALAFRYGFTDASHLSKTFKKHFGLSPHDYGPAK